MGTTPNRSWSRCPRNSSWPRRTAGGAAPPALARRRARPCPVDRCLRRRDLRAWPDHQHQGKARPAAPSNLCRPSKMMHPAMLQQLAAERAKDMIATADRARRAQHARRARRWRTSATGAAPPAAHRVQTRTAVSTKPTATDPTASPTSGRLAPSNLRNRPWPRSRHPPTGSVQGRDGPSGGPGPAYQTRRSNPMSDAPIGPDHPAITCRAGSPDSREWVNCDRYPDQVGTGPARLVRRLIDSLVRGWHDGVYLHQRRLEAQRPWEKKDPFTGDANWAVGGSSVPASHHKTDHAPRSMIAMKIQRRESVWTDDERIIRHLPFSDDRQPA